MTIDKIRNLLSEIEARAHIVPGQSVDKIKGYEEILKAILDLDERLRKLEK
jgi:hypothetical protein